MVKWVLPPDRSTWDTGDSTRVNPEVATVEWVRLIGGPSYDDYYKEEDDAKQIGRLVQRLEDEEEIDPPTAHVRVETGEVIGFDGGHRLRAALEAGIREMPLWVEWVNEQGETVSRPSHPTIKSRSFKT